MPDRPLVLVSSPLFERQRIIDRLQAAGCRTAPLPQDPVTAGTALLVQADGAIVSPECQLTEQQIAMMRRLRIVVSPVIGTDHIAVDALTRRGVAVAHGADPVNFIGMAEAVIGLIVSLLHRFGAKEAALRAGRGRIDHPGRLLRGRTIGLVGAGRIGRAIIERLAGWECRILVADPRLTVSEAGGLGVALADLDEVLTMAEVLTVQVPLTAGTRGLLGAPELARLPHGAHLVNVGRGGVVDEEALVEALRTGRIAGAAVDVWDQEPPPADHPLLAFADRVIATPHNVGHTLDAYHRLADLAVEQMLRGLAGERPRYVVNPSLFDD
ncbi:D-isomer specific 2-hydroxyacid dehydrogenase family protein [uncultured Aeromicrobium sp.]|uniref:NAD(P)-dependent oxidoreductase n=1 Tax=uncultured Aeromicrobium sp. TaxID=337820 RepID=UPI0025E4CB2A|nr:NAD(P)-dependent oxidoreductase [uncultured Aeromicrobium sp.]